MAIDLPGHMDLDPTTACLRPGCAEPCTYDAGRGRPPRFCSDRCRNAYAIRKRTLLRELHRTHRLIASSIGRPRIELQQRETHIRWLLLRYSHATDAELLQRATT